MTLDTAELAAIATELRQEADAALGRWRVMTQLYPGWHRDPRFRKPAERMLTAHGAILRAAAAFEEAVIVSAVEDVISDSARQS